MNKLPDTFCISSENENNPLYDKFIKWLNDQHESKNYIGGVFRFYGLRNKKCFASDNAYDFNKNILTLEQWDEIVNGFTLPEYWYVVVTEDNKEVLVKWRFGESNIILKPGYVVGYPKDSKKKGWDEKKHNCWVNEITFEQFKKYVLNQNNMEKEIIGYKLVKPGYKEAAFKIANIGSFNNLSNGKYDVAIHSHSAGKLRNAGVLDLWFEPVYKEVPTELYGYKVSVDERRVKFGCENHVYSQGELLKVISTLTNVPYNTLVGDLVKDLNKFIK